jgi:hypothetical protein
MNKIEFIFYNYNKCKRHPIMSTSRNVSFAPLVRTSSGGEHEEGAPHEKFTRDPRVAPMPAALAQTREEKAHATEEASLYQWFRGIYESFCRLAESAPQEPYSTDPGALHGPGGLLNR